MASDSWLMNKDNGSRDLIETIEVTCPLILGAFHVTLCLLRDRTLHLSHLFLEDSRPTKAVLDNVVNCRRGFH